MRVDAKKAGVMGWPVGHSLSPRLHGYWLEQYGIQGSYEALAVEPEKLETALRSLPGKGFAGVNLTIPHKERALGFMDSLDETARRVGAVNTVVVREGKLHGMNTDVYGFMENLRASYATALLPGGEGSFNLPPPSGGRAGVRGGHKLRPRHWLPLILTFPPEGGRDTGKEPQGKNTIALVLGAGGAARAACYGLSQAGWRIALAGRTRAKAEALARDMNCEAIVVADWNDLGDVMRDADLLVNTTPLGMEGQEPREISLANLPAEAFVYDIVYRPLITPLLQAAKARGNRIVTGFGMLAYQAQPAFEAWFGVTPEVSEALAAHVLGTAP